LALHCLNGPTNSGHPGLGFLFPHSGTHQFMDTSLVRPSFHLTKPLQAYSDASRCVFRPLNQPFAAQKTQSTRSATCIRTDSHCILCLFIEMNPKIQLQALPVAPNTERTPCMVLQKHPQMRRGWNRTSGHQGDGR
jgi:hypothetical protein